MSAPSSVANKDQDQQTVSFLKRKKSPATNSKGTNALQSIFKFKTIDAVSGKFVNQTSPELPQEGSSLPIPVKPGVNSPTHRETLKPLGAKSQGKTIVGPQSDQTLEAQKVDQKNKGLIDKKASHFSWKGNTSTKTSTLNKGLLNIGSQPLIKDPNSHLLIQKASNRFSLLNSIELKRKKPLKGATTHAT